MTQTAQDQPIVHRVQCIPATDEIRPEWVGANYAATMPGNFDAFFAALLGCIS